MSASFEKQIDSDTYVREQMETIKNYDFKYENLVLEGGGAKLVAFVGAVQVSELTQLK